MPQSKPGTVGQDMPAALKGEIEGNIAGTYKGRPGNAIPNYPHNPENSKRVDVWTQDYMQEQRRKNRNKH